MHCRIRNSWTPWLVLAEMVCEQLEIVQEARGTTLLCGYLADQAALYGVLLKVHNLGLTLLALETSQTPEGEKQG